MEAPTPASVATAPNDIRDEDRRITSPGRRFLVIAALSGLAVAQPILDLLGNNPETFQINRVVDRGIVLFAVGVVTIPPLAVWGIGEAVRRLHRRLGEMVHLGVVAILLGLFAVLASKEVTDRAVLHAAVAFGAAAGGGWAYRRFDGFGTWLRLLSAANLAFLGQFLFVAPVADRIGAEVPEAADVVVDTGATPAAVPPSVLMLVFDEWPTQSLLAADGTVDDVRFPNLAALAEESTWFRRFTTVSPWTPTAVPAMLDGIDPHGEPSWKDHPDNLFSLLADSHNLIVSESITQLCGFDTCGVRPVPPPPPALETGEPALPVAPPPVEIDTGPRWRRLLDTVRDSWAQRVTPGRRPATEAFDEFVEEVSAVTPEPAPEPLDDDPDANAGLSDDEIALERFLATQVLAQPNRHQLFVDALRPTDEPFLGFLHLMLPHQPWTIRENGTSYDVAADRVDYARDQSDPWPVAVTRQRHLLQAEYADRLLGVIVNRLREIDEYDDTLIVVVSDHGAAFEVDEPSRSLSDANLEQVVYVPLFIKAPGQTRGVIDDSNVNSTDVTPTIADLLGIELPWETDGRPAGSDDVAARGNDKYVYSFGEPFDYEFLGVLDFDAEASYRDLLAGRFPSIDPTDDRLAGLYRDVPGSDLIDRSADSIFGPPDGTASVVELERLRSPGSNRPLLGEIAGRVDDPPIGATVVVAVNDRIVGVSPLYRRSGDDNSFVVLLPADALDPDGNDIRIGLRRPDGDVVELSV
jgi:arylsulfatase A-like enzyme